MGDSRSGNVSPREKDSMNQASQHLEGGRGRELQFPGRRSSEKSIRVGKMY